FSSLVPKLPSEVMAKLPEYNKLKSIHALQTVQDNVFLSLRHIYELPPVKSPNHKLSDRICIQRHQKEALGALWKGTHTVILTTPTAVKLMLKQRDLKVSEHTIKGFLEDIDQAAPWFRASGDVNLPCWEKLGQDLTEAKGRGELRSGTLPLWRLIRYCLKEGKRVDILHEGRRTLSAHQDSMSESDNNEKGNLKEERPKSSKASSKLHTKVEKGKKTDQGKKEKETDQGKTKQKHSGLYLVLDEFSDVTLSDSAEDELDSEEEEDLEEAAAAYERERYCPENTEPPPYYPPKAKLKGISSAPVVFNSHFIKHTVWGRLATAFPVSEDPTTHNRHHEMVGYKQLKDLAEAVRTYGVSASFTEDCCRFAFTLPSVNHEQPDARYQWEYPQVRIIHYMDDILLAAPSQVMLDKTYAHTVQALEKKGLYIAPEKVQKDLIAECWNGTWTLAVIVKVPTFVPIPVKVDPKTFPIMTLLRERRDFGITAAIIAAIVLSAAGAITAAVAMTNQIQTAQTINTVVEQTSAVMETQHRINKHLMSSLWFLCRLRARQARDKAVIIQALAALDMASPPKCGLRA
ncbi:hypothetical protein STEG23_015260, partial [Scotinomys teguina]